VFFGVHTTLHAKRERRKEIYLAIAMSRLTLYFHYLQPTNRFGTSILQLQTSEFLIFYHVQFMKALTFLFPKLYRAAYATSCNHSPISTISSQSFLVHRVQISQFQCLSKYVGMNFGYRIWLPDPLTTTHSQTCTSKRRISPRSDSNCQQFTIMLGSGAVTQSYNSVIPSFLAKFRCIRSRHLAR
jgi:hypothetical protein